MPLVNIEPLSDIPGGTASTTVILVSSVYRNGQPAVRVEGETITFPNPLHQTLTGPTTVNLITPPVDCYWKMEFFLGSQRVFARHIIFPAGSGPFDFADLIDVMPSSPTPDTSMAQWEALLAQITSASNDVIIGGHISGDDLILEAVNGAQSDAGSVRGAPGVGVLVLGQDDPIPNDTPPGTIIVRTLV